jgi:hypothetical protein
MKPPDFGMRRSDSPGSTYIVFWPFVARLAVTA